MASEVANPGEAGLPSIAGTDAWQRPLLNTQLASWAELRHDTILYAKQSYSGGIACEFPDGYVDPYPAAFERLRLYALKGMEATEFLLDADAALAGSVRSYFAELADISGTLKEMAEYQRTGMPFTAEHMAFLNDAVRSSQEGCGGPPVYSGWYARLAFYETDAEYDPTIADVHTNPGTPSVPASVLHVGTGEPRLMVVTVDTCAGPRAYIGVASSYFEVIVEGLDRLTDEEWSPMAPQAADVPWLAPVLPETL